MELLRLRAGPLEMLFDPAAVFLRHIRLGEREVLRGIYGAVRDRHWGTVPTCVRNLPVENGGDHFQIGFDAECCAAGIQFDWRGELSGDAAGTVTFQFDGVARTSFLKNRIGLCVLHPVRECAGQPCQVQHTDGTAWAGEFPRFILPQQPFQDLRAITHQIQPGCRAKVVFRGEASPTPSWSRWPPPTSCRRSARNRWPNRWTSRGVW